MEKVIDGKTLAVNEEGYLENFSEWTESIGEELAREANIKLTPSHWNVIHYIQDQYKKEIPLTIRKIGKSGIVDIKAFYELFPPAPLKTSARIAGIPKPASCI